MATNVTNGRISNMNWAFSHSRLTATQVFDLLEAGAEPLGGREADCPPNCRTRGQDYFCPR